MAGASGGAVITLGIEERQYQARIRTSTTISTIPISRRSMAFLHRFLRTKHLSRRRTRKAAPSLTGPLSLLGCRLAGERALEHRHDHSVAFLVVDARKTVMGPIVRAQDKLFSSEYELKGLLTEQVA